jgi:hypothetical protein
MRKNCLLLFLLFIGLTAIGVWVLLYKWECHTLTVLEKGVTARTCSRGIVFGHVGGISDVKYEIFENDSLLISSNAYPRAV